MVVGQGVRGGGGDARMKVKVKMQFLAQSARITAVAKRESNPLRLTVLTAKSEDCSLQSQRIAPLLHNTFRALWTSGKSRGSFRL